jgi:hypothetical protein
MAAAVTGAWGTAKRRFALLLGLSDATRTELAERRLEQAREQLVDVPTVELMQAQPSVAWETRPLDLLEHPAMADELRRPAEQLRVQQPALAVSAGHYGVAAGRDVTRTASRAGVAAGTIQRIVTEAEASLRPPGRMTPELAEGFFMIQLRRLVGNNACALHTKPRSYG